MMSNDNGVTGHNQLRFNPNDYSNPNGQLAHDERGYTFIPNNLPPSITMQELTGLLKEANSNIEQLRSRCSELSKPSLARPIPCLKRQIVVSFNIEEDMSAAAAGAGTPGISRGRGRSFGYPVPKKAAGYISALEWAFQQVQVEGRDVDVDIIQRIHWRLAGGRYGQMRRSEFRTTLIYLIEEPPLPPMPVYPPPSPEKLPKLLHSLTEFMRTPPADIPILVQCAMVHYQFVAIHPFSCGNGRMSRLLVSLLLSKTELLPEPLFDLGPYFEQHKREYDDLLRHVTEKSHWREWITFFLRAVIVQSKEALECMQKSMDR